MLVGGLVVVVEAQPAAAGITKYVTSNSWAYTDSRDPKRSFVDGDRDAPVGAWLDNRGRTHKSRSYFTFDLAAYHGKRVVSATLVIKETKANDCRKPRQWELWTTAPVTRSTSWANPPRQLKKLDYYDGQACPAPYLEADLAEALRDAVAKKQKTLTLGIRLPANLEGNLRYGRQLANQLGISLDVNTEPGVPTGLTVNGRPCGGPEPLFVSDDDPGRVTVKALITDPDEGDAGSSDRVTATFAVWPADRPAERVEWDDIGLPAPHTAWGRTPEGLLQNGVTYVVAVRSRDDHDVSPWSPECRFTFDTERPTVKPVVTSTDYPENGDFPGSGGPGISGKFTFSANGATDVVGFYYGVDSGSQYVAADRPGGSVTVDFAPYRSGPQELRVRAADRARNTSDATGYRFQVRHTTPQILDADRDAWAGVPHRLTFKPSMEDVVSYTCRLDDGPTQNVIAAADGTAAVTVTPAVQGSTVHVQSITRAGLKSQEAQLYLWVDSAPFVTSEQFPPDSEGAPVGTAGTFTVKPHMHDVVAYVYQFNAGREDEQPERTVSAVADGSATIPFTPARAGNHSLRIASRTSAGVMSEQFEVYFYVRSIAPEVDSTDYPRFQTNGGPGVTGTFAFRPVAASVVGYTYRIGDEPEQQVAAGPDGSATVTWTPRSYDSETGGWVTLRVRSRSANGVVSDEADHSFGIHGLQPEATGPSEGVVGVPSTFTFTSKLAASTEFVYAVDGVDELTAPVGPDGTAVVTWTPTEPSSHTIAVRSRTATGITSGSAYVSIWVSEE